MKKITQLFWKSEMNNPPPTNEWPFPPPPLVFCLFVTLTPSISIFWYEHRNQQHRGPSQTPDQERDEQHQAVVPYPQNYTHELYGTIAGDRPTGIHLGHVWMDANHNARVSGVWGPPQGDSTILLRTDRVPRHVDLSPEYEVHVEDTGSMSRSISQSILFTYNSVQVVQTAQCRHLHHQHSQPLHRHQRLQWLHWHHRHRDQQLLRQPQHLLP